MSSEDFWRRRCPGKAPCAPQPCHLDPSTPRPSLPSLTAVPKLTAAPHKSPPSPWALKEVRLPPRASCSAREAGFAGSSEAGPCKALAAV